MKSQIFKNAWQLVKDLGFNFSAALKLAWAEFKLDAMCLIYNAGSCNDYQLSKKIDVLQSQVNKIKPCAVRYAFEQKQNSMTGAAAWYGIGVYNGD